MATGNKARILGVFVTMWVLAGCVSLTEGPGRSTSSSAARTGRASGAGGSGPAAGPIEVVADQAAYRQGEVITVTVTNNGTRTVYTEDQRTDCSIVTLERKDGDQWIPFTHCGAERAMLVIAIAPGQAKAAHLDPKSTNFTDQPILPGVYRLAFGYRPTAGPEGVVSARAVSLTFLIN